MTAQISEILIYNKEELSLCTEPLEEYFAQGGHNPGFYMTSTANWRGYQGKWEILDDRLYLIEFIGNLGNNEDATLGDLFPGYPKRVFAHWYSGQLRCPMGDLLKYRHMGYASVYAYDLLIEVNKGSVQGREIKMNNPIDEEKASEEKQSTNMDEYEIPKFLRKQVD